MTWLILLLTALVIVDGLVTNLLVNDGVATEANPLMRPLVGGATFILVKIAGAALCSLLLLDVYSRHSRIAVTVTSCLTACYGAIVAWNFHVFFTAP